MTETEQIQIGQVWQKNESGESYLVTQLYTEALATFAVFQMEVVPIEYQAAGTRVTASGSMAGYM